MGEAAQVGVVQRLGPGFQGQHAQATGATQLLVVGEAAEAVDMDEAIHRLPAVAQLLQGADTEAAERQHAAGAQDTLGFPQHRLEVRAPLQRQAGEQQVATAVAQRQALGVAGDELLRTAQRPGMAQHALGDVQGDALGRGETLAEGAAEMPGAAAQVEPALRLERGRQARQQLVADTALQRRDAVVAVGRAGERRGDLALVRQAGGGLGRRLSHHRPRAGRPGSPPPPHGAARGRRRGWRFRADRSRRPAAG